MDFITVVRDFKNALKYCQLNVELDSDRSIIILQMPDGDGRWMCSNPLFEISSDIEELFFETFEELETFLKTITGAYMVTVSGDVSVRV